jgi:hypothetical protein
MEENEMKKILWYATIPFRIIVGVVVLIVILPFYILGAITMVDDGSDGWCD